MTLFIDWINPKRGNQGNGRGVSTGVRLSHSKYQDKATGGYVESTQIRLGPDAMHFCRFVVGDRVQIGIVVVSGQKHLAIKRDTAGRGFTLSNAKGKSVHGSTKDYGVVKMKRRDVPEFDVDTSDCTITSDGIFLIPVNGSANDRA